MLFFADVVESGDFNPDQNDEAGPSYVAAASVLLVPPPVTVSVVEGGRSDEDVNLV